MTFVSIHVVWSLEDICRRQSQLCYLVQLTFLTYLTSILAFVGNYLHHLDSRDITFREVSWVSWVSRMQISLLGSTCCPTISRYLFSLTRSLSKKWKIITIMYLKDQGCVKFVEELAGGNW